MYYSFISLPWNPVIIPCAGFCIIVVICFLTYWRISQSSTSQIGMLIPSATYGSHALMHVHAFTSHLSSPLSPTRTASSHVVSVVHIHCHSPAASLLDPSCLSFLSAYHPSDPITWTFFIHLCLFTVRARFPATCLYLLSSHPPLHTCIFTLHSPLLLCLPSSSHHLSLFHPCQPALTVCRTLGGVSIRSCYRFTKWMMMVLLVLLGCCVLWPGKARMPFLCTKCSDSACASSFVCVCACVCALMHRSLAGRETAGPGCSPKA